MQDTYYNPDDLNKFGAIKDFQPDLAKKFFDWYGDVFKAGALTQREKALIALAVAHAVQCPYCIDAYTVDSFFLLLVVAHIFYAFNVSAAIRGGATLVHGVQMMNKAKEILM